MSINNKINISNQVISMGKEYKTRNGRDVKVLTTSRKHKNNVVYLVNNEEVFVCSANGLAFSYEFDLIEVTKIEEGLKQHDLVMVSDVYDKWNLRFFSHYEDGKAFAFNSGACEGYTTPWDYCRKATPQEIVANKGSLN